jgi:hypothetical protein
MTATHRATWQDAAAGRPPDRRGAPSLEPLERDQLLFHAGYLVVVAAGLLAPAGPVLGWRVALLVGLYHAATVAFAWQRGHRRWLRLWWFGTVLSVFMLLPDAVLVEGLGTLVFPDDGFPDLGPVTGSMAGMWTIATVVVVASADAVGRRAGERMSWLTAVGVAAIVFAGAEAVLTQLPVWEAVGVTTVGGVALYILPAELFLGVAMLAGARWTRTGPLLRVIPVAAVIALAYTGAAAVSWLLIERGLLG